METSKIKSIDKTDNTWTGQSGTMYQQLGNKAQD